MVVSKMYLAADRLDFIRIVRKHSSMFYKILQVILYKPVISCYLGRLKTYVISVISSAQVIHCILMCIYHSRLINLGPKVLGRNYALAPIPWQFLG